jgi:hypothetical protein
MRIQAKRRRKLGRGEGKSIANRRRRTWVSARRAPDSRSRKRASLWWKPGPVKMKTRPWRSE